MQARKWNVASLNEFRGFFNLKRYTTFEEMNPDPYVASTLKKLYDHPDQVEMYPGMFLEASKPRMDPGMGICKDNPPPQALSTFTNLIQVQHIRFLEPCSRML